MCKQGGATSCSDFLSMDRSCYSPTSWGAAKGKSQYLPFLFAPRMGCSDVARLTSARVLLASRLESPGAGRYHPKPRFVPLQALPACPIQATCEAASKEENKEKNRYVNILPCRYQSGRWGWGRGGGKTPPGWSRLPEGLLQLP